MHFYYVNNCLLDIINTVFINFLVYQRVPVHQRNLSIDTNQFTNSDQQVLVHTPNLTTQLQVSTNQVILIHYFYMNYLFEHLMTYIQCCRMVL